MNEIIVEQENEVLFLRLEFIYLLSLELKVNIGLGISHFSDWAQHSESSRRFNSFFCARFAFSTVCSAKDSF